MHILHEALGAAVDVDKARGVALGGQEVYRADAVVEVEAGEVRMGGSPIGPEVVDFHAGVKLYRVVFFAYALNLGEVGGDVVGFHVAGRVEGHGRVGCEAVMEDAGVGGGAGKLVHCAASVAELGVGVQVVS